MYGRAHHTERTMLLAVVLRDAELATTLQLLNSKLNLCVAEGATVQVPQTAAI